MSAYAGWRSEMPLLTWSSKYSVGVEAMDKQHTILFTMINDLHAAMTKGQAQSITRDLLNKLAKYVHEHFAAEEAMMASTRYPELPKHRILHRDLSQKVDEFAARGEGGLNVALLNFLRDWLTSHIQTVDHGYTSWMNEHGVR
jgi:hemerythrin-like metal-binding protein